VVYLTKPTNFTPIFTIVSCVFIVQNETLLLHRLPDKSQGGKWGMPSGKVDPGETLVEAMIREIKEETSVIATKEQLIHFREFYVDSSGKEFTYKLFSLRLTEKPAVLLNTKEHSEYKWTPIGDIFNEDLVDDHPFCMREFLKNNTQLTQ